MRRKRRAPCLPLLRGEGFFTLSRAGQPLARPRRKARGELARKRLRGVSPASSAPLSHGACVRRAATAPPGGGSQGGRAAPGTCVNDCRGGPCGRPAAVTDVLRPRRGEYGNHTPYRRATARVAPTVKNARRCSVGAVHENPRGQGSFRGTFKSPQSTKKDPSEWMSLFWCERGDLPAFPPCGVQVTSTYQKWDRPKGRSHFWCERGDLNSYKNMINQWIADLYDT